MSASPVSQHVPVKRLSKKGWLYVVVVGFLFFWIASSVYFNGKGHAARYHYSQQGWLTSAKFDKDITASLQGAMAAQGIRALGCKMEKLYPDSLPCWAVISPSDGASRQLNDVWVLRDTSVQFSIEVSEAGLLVSGDWNPATNNYADVLKLVKHAAAATVQSVERSKSAPIVDPLVVSNLASWK